MIQFKWKECYGCSSPTRCEAEKTCYIIAPRAAEAGEDKELAAGVLRLTGTIRYLVGIAERGEGRSIRHDETVESFVLHYVQRLEQGRPAIIEECARVCEQAGPRFYDKSMKEAAESCAAAIRALAPGGQKVGVHDVGDFYKDEGHAGPAVAAPNGARDGDIVEFLCGGGTFKGCWYGGEKPSDEKGNFWWRKYLRAALRAAPSLSREEWGMLYRLLDKEIPPGVKTAEFEPWIALRAKVSKNAK